MCKALDIKLKLKNFFDIKETVLWCSQNCVTVYGSVIMQKPAQKEMLK